MMLQLLARRARATTTTTVGKSRRRHVPPCHPPHPDHSIHHPKVNRRWASNGPTSGRPESATPLTCGVGPHSSSIDFARRRRVSHPQHQTTRGKKTKTVVRLGDLPQGLILPTTTTTGKEEVEKEVEGDEGTKKKKRKKASEKTTTTTTSRMRPLEDNHEPPASPTYPTVILQARRNMQKFENCVLLTRVGSFYELYFDHAEECGPLMNIKVIQKKTAAGPVPMVTTPSALFPLHIHFYFTRGERRRTFLLLHWHHTQYTRTCLVCRVKL